MKKVYHREFLNYTLSCLVTLWLRQIDICFERRHFYLQSFWWCHAEGKEFPNLSGWIRVIYNYFSWFPWLNCDLQYLVTDTIHIRRQKVFLCVDFQLISGKPCIPYSSLKYLFCRLFSNYPCQLSILDSSRPIPSHFFCFSLEDCLTCFILTLIVFKHDVSTLGYVLLVVLAI